MGIAKAALMIRSSQKPKRLQVYQAGGFWVVRNPWTKTHIYVGEFADVAGIIDEQLLERLWQISIWETA